jgi:hypothetical protein
MKVYEFRNDFAGEEIEMVAEEIARTNDLVTFRLVAGGNVVGEAKVETQLVDRCPAHTKGFITGKAIQAALREASVFYAAA